MYVVAYAKAISDGVLTKYHKRDVIRFPFVFVVSSQLKNAHDLVDFFDHAARQVVAVLGRFIQTLAACRESGL
jgi:hypothetical protein